MEYYNIVMRQVKMRFLGPLFQYMKEFTPEEWGKKRPFAFEPDYKPYGLILKPRDENIRRQLEKISNVRLRRDGLTFIIKSGNAQSIARIFYWFALRSLRVTEYRNLWALIHSILNSNDNSASVEEMSSLTNIDSSECKNWLEKLADKQVLVRKGNKYMITENSGKFLCLYRKCTSAAPTQTEEFVMELLCSNYGLYKGEVCDSMSKIYGLGKSAVYKATNNLKNSNFIRIISKHVGKRGPARDYLFVNCQNCFFQFASKEECLEHEMTNLAKNLEKGFARELKNEERIALLEFIKGRAEGPQLLRKLNLTLYYFNLLKEEITENESLKEAVLFLEKEINLALKFR